MESLRSSDFPTNNYNYREVIIEEEDGGLLSLPINSNDFRRKTKTPSPADHAKLNKVAVAALKRQPIPPLTEDINQSAEAFIRKFRQQLAIQRMKSIENYEKMLARGT